MKACTSLSKFSPWLRYLQIRPMLRVAWEAGLRLLFMFWSWTWNGCHLGRCPTVMCKTSWCNCNKMNRYVTENGWHWMCDDERSYSGCTHVCWRYARLKHPWFKCYSQSINQTLFIGGNTISNEPLIITSSSGHTWVIVVNYLYYL